MKHKLLALIVTLVLLPGLAWTNRAPAWAAITIYIYGHVSYSGTPLFRVDDLKDSTSFVVKLRDASDPLSLFLQEQFSPETQQLLNEYDDSSPPSESLQEALIDELNELLQGPSLYDEDRFAHVTLSQETQQLIAQSPEGESLIRLNRLLLEEAYPHETGKSHYSYVGDIQSIGPSWTATILAEGQDLGLGEVTVNSVEIGVTPVAEVFPAVPFPPPQYSVKMDLYTSDLTTLLAVDIRKEGDIQYTWIIGVDPHGNVGSPVVPATATLSWDPIEFGPGTYQLQEGYDGTGDIVVADMKTITSYDVEGLQFPPQFFTVIFTEIDSDEDEVPDSLDNCPNSFNPNQEDGDGDGAGDACDDCPDDPNKTASGACGCGIPDTDSDSDGTPDCIDGCPSDPGKADPGECGCGTPDTDSDGDGMPDCTDMDDDNDRMSDIWEIDNSLDPWFDDANEDSDGDGFSNFREYVGATNPQDPDDFPPLTTFDLNLPSGWSMLSLPVISESISVANLFPEAVVVYGYEPEKGYVRITKQEALEVGKGYWILLNEEKTYTLTGQPIRLYTRTIFEDGRAMIGGCSSLAQASLNNCNIDRIYRYVQGAKYQQVLESEYLEPGKGYWILINDITDQTELRVEAMTQSGK